MNPELSYATKPASAEPEPAPQNFFSRLIGVWFSPGETFAEIGRAPRMLAPILALMFIGSFTNYVMVNRLGVQAFFKPGFDQAVKDNRMTQEDADKQLEAMTSGPMGTVTRWVMPLFGLFLYVVMALILVGIAKLITMLLGGENRFKPLFSVSLFTLLATGIITSILTIVIFYLKSPEEIDINNPLGSNLAAILTLAFGKDGLPKFVMALSRWVDVFGIWMVSLLAIGFAAVSKRIKSSSFGMALGGIYIALALIAASWAALTG